jgi:predicted transcriptional regulator
MLEIHLADPLIEHFIRNVVNDFIKLDIVLFFSRDGRGEASVEEIARYIGRSNADVEKALVKLANSGLVVAAHDAKKLYGLSKDNSVRTKMESLLRLYGNITERLKIISILIQASEQV